MLFVLMVGTLLGVAPGVQSPHPALDERLFAAVRAGKATVVRALLDKGANPNGIEANDWRPLTALGGTDAETLAVARLLVERGARVNARQRDQGWTALTITLNRPNPSLDLVRYLLLKGADPNLAMNDGETPLHFAVRSKNVQLVDILLSHGASVSARTNDREIVYPNRGPQALPSDRVRSDQFDQAFEPGFRNAGRTPFHELGENWNRAVALRLLASKADRNAVDVNGWTALHFAAKAADSSAIAGLIELGLDPNAASRGGFRPLHIALRAGFGFPNVATVRLLIQKGADPKARNKMGQTPLEQLRADAQRRVQNPSNDPETAFPAELLPRYQAMVDAAARELDPSAPPIRLTLPRPNPRGQRYAPLELFEGEAERTVRVENGQAILELRLPPLAHGSATMTVREIALEEYDTLTPLPMVVKRKQGVPNVLVFRFPAGAARGGDVSLSASQIGSDGTSRDIGGMVSGAESDATHPQPAFTVQDGLVAVSHHLPDRVMEFEIVSARRAGHAIPGLAGRRLRVPSREVVRIPGLRVPADSMGGASGIQLDFRFRYLPNVKWRRGSMPL